MIDWTWRGNEKIESFVIIDDNNDMDNLISYLVQTNPKNGLTKEDAEKAIKILNGDKL